MNKTALMLLLIAAGSIAAIQTKAQTKTPCGPKEVVYDRLLNEYGERPIVMGMRDSQGVFAFWMNEETGTWTIICGRFELPFTRILALTWMSNGTERKKEKNITTI